MGVVLVAGVAVVAYLCYQSPVRLQSILIIVGLALSLIAVAAIAKFVTIVFSLRRCPTPQHPKTLRPQAPRWMLWCGIALTGSPLACVALAPLMPDSIFVPLLITLPICLIGVYVWQTASLRRGRNWI